MKKELDPTSPQGVFRALKTLKALKTLNSEYLTLKTPKTLKRPVIFR